jgi:hypothetical protein
MNPVAGSCRQGNKSYSFKKDGKSPHQLSNTQIFKNALHYYLVEGKYIRDTTDTSLQKTTQLTNLNWNYAETNDNSGKKPHIICIQNDKLREQKHRN